MLKIQIPKPCHEDWNKMTPTQQGAFCGACNKEVVDFTKMTDEEIQHYFMNRASGKTCGRFQTEQMDRIQIYLPETVLLKKGAGWKKFMVVILVAFGSMLFGCEVRIKNDAVGKVDKTQVDPADTNKIEALQTLGTPVYFDTTILKIEGTTTGTIKIEKPPVPKVVGSIIMIADTTAKPIIDTPDADKTFTGKILLETKADTVIKKPVSDTSKCKDTGYY